MIPGQLIAPEQLTDPGVNFASVHGLTPVTVHMNFSLPRGNIERRVTRLTEGTFSIWTERKSCPGARVVLAHAHYCLE